MGDGGSARGRDRGRLGRRADVGPPGQRVTPGAARARPVRVPHRRDRVPPRLPPPHGRRGSSRAPRRAVVGSTSGRPRGAGGGVVRVVAGRSRAHLPDLDDLLDRARAPRRTRRGEGLGAAADDARVRPVVPTGPGEGGRDRGHGDDGEAGRLGRAGEHVDGRGGRRRPPAHRSQVVLLRAGLGSLPHARPDRRRDHLLRGSPLPARRHAQPHPHPAAQGQAGQPLQRVGRDRVRGRVGTAGRRGGARGSRRSSRW